MREEWREIAGYDGRYEVSSMGQFRSWANTRWGHRSVPVLLKPRKPDHGGHLLVQLRLPGKVCYRFAHQLVLETFVGPRPFEGAEVRHLNGVPGDNRLVNLAWGTREDNIEDKFLHGTSGKKLTAKQIPEIRRLAARGMSQREIGEKFGINQSGVSKILTGETWKHVQ